MRQHLEAFIHADGLARCPWCGTDPVYMAYHDQEWGVPEHDSRALFEKLLLDSFQAGLSWITILRKRDAFRTAFHGFDPEIIASYTDVDIERLMQNAGIVRNRAKILASIDGARAYIQLEETLGFSNFIWRRVDGRPYQTRPHTLSDVPVTTPLAEALSRDLRHAGFRFVGPTVVYAFCQAVGVVNDHLLTCHAHDACARLGTST